jgi:two-component system, OmpR family, sensor histidine kinase CiaH
MKQLERKEFWARITLYVLAFYILFQIVWWGTSIIQLSLEIAELKQQKEEKLDVYAMIWGEGSVFVALILGGFFYVHRTLNRAFHLSRIQRAFMLSVTHELKTPVSAIKLGLETVRNQKLSPEQFSNCLIQMNKESARLQTLSDNIVLAARLDANDSGNLHEPVNLSEMILRCNRLHYGGHTHFIANIEEDVWISGDEILLKSMYMNLVDNALKYNSPKGKVKVDLRSHQGSIYLEIADDGPGIPTHEREKVKKKFYRMGDENTRKHQGTGLGLFIVDQIAKLHRAQWLISGAPSNGCQMILKWTA